MAGNGGARPGAGRKRKAEKFETQIQRAEKKIADKLPMLVDKALEIGKRALAFEKGLQKAGYKAGKPAIKLPVEAGVPLPTLPLDPGTVVAVEEKGYKKGFWQRLFDLIFRRSE